MNQNVIDRHRMWYRLTRNGKDLPLWNYDLVTNVDFQEDLFHVNASATVAFSLASAAPDVIPGLTHGEDFKIMEDFIFQDVSASSPGSLDVYDLWMGTTADNAEHMLSGYISNCSPKFGESGEVTLQIEIQDLMSIGPGAEDENNPQMYDPETSPYHIIGDLLGKVGFTNIKFAPSVASWLQSLTMEDGFAVPRGQTLSNAVKELMEEYGLTYDIKGQNIYIYDPQFATTYPAGIVLVYRPTLDELSIAGELYSWDPNFTLPGTAGGASIAGLDANGNPVLATESPDASSPPKANMTLFPYGSPNSPIDLPGTPTRQPQKVNKYISINNTKDAQRVAQKMTWTGPFTQAGQGTCAGNPRIRNGRNCALFGLGALWTGKYQIIGSQHSMSPEEYSTTFTAMANSFMGTGGDLKDAVNASNYDSSDPYDGFVTFTPDGSVIGSQ